MLAWLMIGKYGVVDAASPSCPIVWQSLIHDLHPSVDLSFSTVPLHVVLSLPRFLSSFKSSPIGVSSYSVDSAYVMSVVCCVFHRVNNDLDHRTIQSTTGSLTSNVYLWCNFSFYSCNLLYSTNKHLSCTCIFNICNCFISSDADSWQCLN